MFFVCLFLAFSVILLLFLKHGRSKYKKLITLTVFMIMVGMSCWAYNDVNFAAGYPSYGSTAFDALINQPLVWTIGMSLLALSVPCALFCLLSKPQKVEEIDKLLEDQDDIN